jgi:rubrerythrin
VTIETTSELLSGLRNAFAAEAMTAQRFTYFARIADVEGYPEIARLFDEMADSIACAAHGHLDWLQHAADPSTDRPIGDTELNLGASLRSELDGASQHYPALAEAARTDGLDDLASWFETLRALKDVHLEKLERALDALTARHPAAATGGARP